MRQNKKEIMICDRELLATVVIFVSSLLAAPGRSSALVVGGSPANVIGPHSTNEIFTHQIQRHLDPSSVLGYYHPAVLVLLRGADRTRALAQVLFGGLRK